ncbi:hypothetical protein PICMEDRAFT_100754 [Pichia membranifaciens NRRL Y-2026]|uniref:Uncharacterized protein n=1 Tax=Pichia membranifaciens NRRL Y-2026 TaxID=763406 RepID=A0A1E3NV08_9ASCO|nr:hypothetical protein PICMEDRAFT_100754 [Pichia membranifaciens NRRL Y-2026]ODQ49383.1 hypothetical protein PICMEDRAFT_100754 [Pichia membranifaciens NRRL Y-2026]
MRDRERLIHVNGTRCTDEKRKHPLQRRVAAYLRCEPQPRPKRSSDMRGRESLRMRMRKRQRKAKSQRVVDWFRARYLFPGILCVPASKIIQSVLTSPSATLC